MKLHEIQQSAEDAVEKHEAGKKKIQNLSDSLKTAMDNHSRLCTQMPSLRSHLQQAIADKERRASQIADSMERQGETYSGPEAPESCYDERIGTMREQIVALEIEIRKADARAEFLRGALIQAEREDAETTDQLKSYSCELDRIIRNYIQQRKPLSEAHSSGFGEHLRTLSEQFSKSQEKCMRLREKILKSLGTAADCVYPEPEKLSALHPGTGRGAKAARSTPGGCLPKSGTSTSGQAGQTKPYIYKRHLTSNETSARWKISVKCIDSEIESYKQELLSRGVPDCKWLNNTLAKHRAAMLEQEGYNLDVASGNEQISTHSPTAYSYPPDYKSFFDKLADEFRQHSLDKTNPNYSLAPQWKNNCQRCVPTLEMRRRGSVVTARPSTYGSDHLSYHPFDVWQNANVLNCRGNGLSDIQHSMSEWGDGARAQVVVYWDIPHGGGHTFIAEQRNGETIFSDPQTGNMNVKSYFNRVVLDRTQFCRIDNLEFSNYINECYQEAQE